MKIKILALSFCFFFISVLNAQSLYLDSSFGKNGRLYELMKDFPFNTNEIQPLILKDSGLLINLQLIQDSVSGFILYKTNKNGSLNNDFGNQGKYFYYHQVDTDFVIISSIIENPNGDYYLALNTRNRYKTNSCNILKIKKNGGIDVSFGNNGIYRFEIGDSNLNVSKIALHDTSIIIVGTFQKANFKSIFIKSINTNGTEHLMKGNKSHLEFLGDQTFEYNASDFSLNYPDIYIVGNSIINKVSKHLLFIKSNLLNINVNDEIQIHSFSKWESHTVVKAVFIKNQLWGLCNLKKDNNYSSLILKMDNNLNLDQSFGDNGMFTPKFVKGILSYDFEIKDSTIYFIGERIYQFYSDYFLDCIDLNGQIKTNFSNNGTFIFKTIRFFPSNFKVLDHKNILISGISTGIYNYQVMEIQKYNLLKTQNTTSLESNLFKNLSVYPNPSDGIVYFNQIFEKAIVLNHLGQEIINQQNSEYIDLSLYNSGYYVLELWDKNSVKRIKINKI